MVTEHKRLGDVLVDAGILTKSQLEQAILFQKNKNKRLGKILVELGFATEHSIAEAMSKQLAIPYVDCNKVSIAEEVKKLLPLDMIEKNVIVPIEIKEGALVIAMADPLDFKLIDSLAFITGLKISPVVSNETDLLNTIETHYGALEKAWEVMSNFDGYGAVEFKKDVSEDLREFDINDIYKSSNAPPIIRLVTSMIVDAVKLRATDIHVEPREKHVQVRYRIDGDLRDVLKIPKNIQNPVCSRIKIVSKLDITNRRLPQDGGCFMKVGKKEVDLRISTLPSIYGEKIVIRLLDKSISLVSLHLLGMQENVLNSLIDTFNQPQGILIVTGPTGSGKTSTLYACLKQLQSDKENIVTIEDPVEYRLEGITQVQVDEKTGLTFPAVLRSILRQDPDRIMIGEIRDLETAEIAIRSSLTGHFVMSTLHTNSSIATIIRLHDMGVPDFLISSSLSGILAQRLVRKICIECKVETETPVDLINKWIPSVKHSYHGQGCQKCLYTGYYGQTGVFEYLKINTRLRRLIAENTVEEDLFLAAKESGLITLADDAWKKVEDGVTTIEEVLSKIPQGYTKHNKQSEET